MLDAIEVLRLNPPVLPVTHAGDLVGMLSVGNVNEFLLLHATPRPGQRIRRSRED